jgi:hypothetical protein
MIGLLLLLVLMVQEPLIVTCTVKEPDKSVACPEVGKVVLFTFTDQAEAKDIFEQWRLVAPMRGGRVNPGAPLYNQDIKSGDKVKAVITDRLFKAVASCEVRVWRNIKIWRMFREGEGVPDMLYTLPDDCQPWYGKQE